jgi:aminoglycoside phosphotransferase (APT) family kinase protein
MLPGKRLGSGREAEVFAWGDGAVLKLARSPGAGPRLEQEAAAQQAAYTGGVNVPAVRGLEAADGRPGIVMDRLDGPDLITALGKEPWRLRKVGQMLGEVHASIHEVVAPEQLPSVSEGLARQVAAAPGVSGTARKAADDALRRLPDGDRLCHMDFHPGNLILADGKPFVIDWAGATRGDPDADVCRTLLLLEIGKPPGEAPFLVRRLSAAGRKVLLWEYMRTYRRHRTVDDHAVRAWRLPLLVARLSEGIAEEQGSLLRRIDGAVAGR